MGPVRVVMLDVLGEHGLEVTAAEDEPSIEALAPDGADDVLADGARARSLDRGLDDPDDVGSEDGVEGCGVLVSRSRMRNLTGFARSARSFERLRACWVTQLATGIDLMPAIRTRRLSWWMNTST